MAYRHELKRVQVKADIGITTPWHRQGNNLINCTEISLMNSYVVISMRSNSRMSFSFLMGQHSCSFGSAPILFLFFFSPSQFSSARSLACSLCAAGRARARTCSCVQPDRLGSSPPAPRLPQEESRPKPLGEGSHFEINARSKGNCRMVSL